MVTTLRTASLESLDIRHLRALMAVVEHGTFASAADALGFTQSAVSQQIASLERLVGEQLFDRPGGPRPVTLTAAGRLVVKHAERMLEQVKILERELTGYKTGSAGRIDVGVFQSVAVKVLPAVVGRLLRETQADVRPHESNNDTETVRRVESGELDVCFVASPVRVPASFELIEVVSDPFVVVAPAGYESGDVISMGQLAEVPLIGQPVSDTCQIRISAGLVDGGVNPDYVFRTNDNAALQSMVREGMGLAVMPLLGVDVGDPKILVRRLEPPIPPRTISLVIPKNPSPMVRRFADLAIEVCREAVQAVSSASDIL
ncbi:MAG TPA: LysR family transcriptional regulator [Acidimicrobiia bacterium]|jgi:DNA-binding transcriptional LysR family regulator